MLQQGKNNLLAILVNSLDDYYSLFYFRPYLWKDLQWPVQKKRKEENVLQQQTPNPACLASFVDPLLIPLD